MPLLSATQLVDGRPTHQILAIEERYESVTIAISPRCVRVSALIGALALIALAAALWMFALATIFGEGDGSLGYRLYFAVAITAALAGVLGFLVVRMRKHLNYRKVTVTDGIVTLVGGPIWPAGKTLQLTASDGMRVAYRERGLRRWTLRNERREPIREYGVYVSGTRGKEDWDVEIIPPFTLSQHEASKLAALMQKFAYPLTEEAMIGSRI